MKLYRHTLNLILCAGDREFPDEAAPLLLEFQSVLTLIFFFCTAQKLNWVFQSPGLLFNADYAVRSITDACSIIVTLS